MPHTISTDLNIYNVDHPVGSLPETMSKVLGAGCRPARRRRHGHHRPGRRHPPQRRAGDARTGPSGRGVRAAHRRRHPPTCPTATRPSPPNACWCPSAACGAGAGWRRTWRSPCDAGGAEPAGTASPPEPGGPTPPVELAEGLRRALAYHWHPVCRVADLPGPVPVRLLGRDLVVARLGDGDRASLLVAEDRCPHRSVRLSIGTIEDGCLRCAYHGWAFDGGGRCVDIPSMPGGPIPERAGVTAYEAEARYGLVWARLDPAAGTAVPPCPALRRPGHEGVGGRALHLAGLRAAPGGELRRPRPFRLRPRRDAGPAGPNRCRRSPPSAAIRAMA